MEIVRHGPGYDDGDDESEDCFRLGCLHWSGAPWRTGVALRLLFSTPRRSVGSFIGY